MKKDGKKNLPFLQNSVDLITIFLQTEIHMKRYLKLFALFAFAAVGVILSSPSIQAQIKNIYDTSEENVAGITSLMSAVTSDDLNGVKFFSKAGPALINQQNIGGATALHLACRDSSFEVIKILIDNGADVNIADNEGWTPLMRASLAAKKEAVDLLLTKGAQASALNLAGESAIFHAASSDCNDCLGLMFAKYDFAKFMEIDALKLQLTDSFSVARNRSNQIGQDMIAAYLDRLAQAAPLSSLEKQRNITAEDKKFVFKTDQKPEKQFPKNQNKFVEEPIVQIPLESKGEFTQQDMDNFGNKFKFVVGEQGKMQKKVSVVKEGTIIPEKKDKVKIEAVSSAPIEDPEKFKFVTGEQGKVQEKARLKKTVVKEEAVVVPVKKDPVETADTTALVDSNYDGEKFKFIVGEQGKVRGKSKNKISVVKEDAVVLEKKDEVKTDNDDEEIVLTDYPETSNAVVYKLNAGPKGKLIKRKKKPVAAPAVVAPIADSKNTIVQPAAPTTTTVATTVKQQTTPVVPPAVSTTTTATPQVPATPVAVVPTTAPSTE